MQFLQELRQSVDALLDNCLINDGRKFLLDFSILLYGLHTNHLIASELSIRNISIDARKIWEDDAKLAPLTYPYDVPFRNLDKKSFEYIQTHLVELQNNLSATPNGCANLFNCMLESMYQARLIYDFITPVALADMMIHMLSPVSGESVLDPTCGSGRLLVAASTYNENMKLSGVDRDPIILTISFFNMRMNKIIKTNTMTSFIV